MSLDIWTSSAGSSSQRSSIVGFSNIGGICSQNQYSIVEYLGFNEIQNAAHELGHKFVNFSIFRYTILENTNVTA